jgi:hypothetical protein
MAELQKFVCGDCDYKWEATIPSPCPSCHISVTNPEDGINRREALHHAVSMVGSRMGDYQETLRAAREFYAFLAGKEEDQP